MVLGAAVVVEEKGVAAAVGRGRSRMRQKPLHSWEWWRGCLRLQPQDHENAAAAEEAAAAAQKKEENKKKYKKTTCIIIGRCGAGAPTSLIMSHLQFWANLVTLRDIILCTSFHTDSRLSMHCMGSVWTFYTYVWSSRGRQGLQRPPE
jgi:hypothetical protein